ncbi:hypothetical protein EYF80_018997 [Liparis tanakae]|uniref:Uncharacterized protein n=1 Tax=Liparis tanakae TaxID=230148 RepID=A0A4Z2I0A8_9TELE|nr:hypothetical protein EYF80_018997 [Liparis tanakae]
MEHTDTAKPSGVQALQSKGDGVGQSPVRVVGHHQVVNALHRLLLSRIHLLPAKVSAAPLSHVYSLSIHGVYHLDVNLKLIQREQHPVSSVLTSS